MKKILHKRNIIIASIALILLFAFAILNPWTNLIDTAFASGRSNYFSSSDTTDLKNLEMPDKGGNILYVTNFATPTDKADLWAINCNTKSKKSMGKLGINLAHSGKNGELRGTPGYFKAENKLSWIFQYYYSGGFITPSVSEDWFVDGNTGDKSKLKSQVYKDGWEVAAVGDMNGDGIEDPIWRNSIPIRPTLDRVAVWYTLDPQNTTTDSQWLESVKDDNWQIKGAGDVNGDKQAEILWYNQKTDQIALWTYRNNRHEGVYLPNGGNLMSRYGTLLGLADCDGDGKSELIFRDWDYNKATVYLGYWKIDSNTMTSVQGGINLITTDRTAIWGVYVRTGTF
jgi:hypothetical protein